MDPFNDQEPVDYVCIDFEINHCQWDQPVGPEFTGLDDSEVPSQFNMVRQDASAPVPSQFHLVRQNATAPMLSRDSYILISDTEEDESSRHGLDPFADSRKHKRACRLL